MLVKEYEYVRIYRYVPYLYSRVAVQLLQYEYCTCTCTYKYYRYEYSYIPVRTSTVHCTVLTVVELYCVQYYFLYSGEYEYSTEYCKLSTFTESIP